MKKTLLTLIIGAIGFTNANAQCTPDNLLNGTGVYFDETNVPCINEYYSNTIQMAIVNDTTVFSIPASLDSVRITSITGIPSGMSHECASPNCTVVASAGSHTQTCVVISGTPTETGSYNIQFTADLYALGSKLTQVFDIPGTVIDCINGIDNNNFSQSISVYPQPTKDNTIISFNIEKSIYASISITDIHGKNDIAVYDGIINSGKTDLPLNEHTSKLTKGVYLITTQLDNDIITKKLIIE